MNEHRARNEARESFNGVQNGFTSAAENVRDVNVRLIDMARANTIAAFDFAHEVTEAKGPSEFIQAWTTNAMKQFDILTRQASELTTLGQRFANTTADSVTRRANHRK